MYIAFILLYKLINIFYIFRLTGSRCKRVLVCVFAEFTRYSSSLVLFVFGTPESDEGYFIVGPSSPSPGGKSPGQCQRFSDSPSRTNELQRVGVLKPDVTAKKKKT